MSIKYCHNAKTGEIFSYEVAGSLTDLPRGALLAYGDYLTTGFDSAAEAEEWAKEYGDCPKCESACKAVDGKCQHCGGKIEFRKAKVTP